MSQLSWRLVHLPLAAGIIQYIFTFSEVVEKTGGLAILVFPETCTPAVLRGPYNSTPNAC